MARTLNLLRCAGFCNPGQDEFAEKYAFKSPHALNGRICLGNVRDWGTPTKHLPDIAAAMTTPFPWLQSLRNSTLVTPIPPFILPRKAEIKNFKYCRGTPCGRTIPQQQYSHPYGIRPKLTKYALCKFNLLIRHAIHSISLSGLSCGSCTGDQIWQYKLYDDFAGSVWVSCELIEQARSGVEERFVEERLY